MDPVVAGIVEVSVLLREDGLDVRDVPGWETRGSGPMGVVRGLVRHHTGSPPGSSSHASLRVVTHGREGLRNSLSAFYQPRESAGPQLWVVAARTSWHAGRGGWVGDEPGPFRPATSNRTDFGVEVENDGRSEPFGPAQMHVTRRLEFRLAQVFGWQAGLTGCEHGEHAPGRKVDRHGMDGRRERLIVADLMQEDDMAGKAALKLIRIEGGDAVWAVTGSWRELVRSSAVAVAMWGDRWRELVEDVPADSPLAQLPKR